MHENACQPFLDYFSASKRLVTIDVSSGSEAGIWDKAFNLFTGLDLKAWRQVDSNIVFALGESYMYLHSFTGAEAN